MLVDLVATLIVLSESQLRRSTLILPFLIEQWEGSRYQQKLMGKHYAGFPHQS